MSAPPFDPATLGAPSFVAPYLRTLDRLQERQTLTPAQLTDRARALLHARFGASGSDEAAFAHGALGLLAGHTHYHDGFAVLMPLAHGAAVALRQTEAPRSRIGFEGRDETWTYDASAPLMLAAWPIWPRVVAMLGTQLAAGRQIEAAVVSTVPSGCVEAYLAALGVATARALHAHFALADGTAQLVADVNRTLAAATGLPFSPVYALAAEAGQPGTFVLADSASGEHLPVPGPPPDAVGWGLVEVGGGWTFEPARHHKWRARADAVLAQLQQRGFGQLETLRDLEHQQLENALRNVSRRYRGVLRHLAAENRRVQRLVVAARRGDWQLFGALLLISHASVRDDWRYSNDVIDAVVAEVESMTLDGMYGACVTGRGGSVLLLGAPPAVPLALDRATAALQERFERPADGILL